MKRTDKGLAAADEPRPEYHLDYRESRPNRFAPEAGKTRIAVVLEPDVAKVFGSAKRVNQALRRVMRGTPKP
ncbi:MAG: hypothetical protein AB7P99_15905 [Vicinamibacterales bacterium]